MYKLVNVNKPKLAIMTSRDLVTLWSELDSHKKQTPVIVDSDGVIVAGHETAWAWAKLKGFKI